MIKNIEVLDRAKEEGIKKYSNIGVNQRFGSAYFNSLEAENDFLNFDEVIWDYDVSEIMENCKRFGITKFTISKNFSSIMEVIQKFQKGGFMLVGLTEVNSVFSDWKDSPSESTEKLRLPAFALSCE
jgi:hypothetical protein